MFLVLLLLVGGVVGLLLKSNLEAPEVPVDCDVGPWGEWTSCYLPPDMCGVGSKDRSREQLADAAHNGEMCSSTRIISLTEQDTCNKQPCEIMVLRRKEVGNVANYFEKSFEEYKNGFESKGEIWIGLKKLRQLTYTGNYGLEVRLKDFDDLTYQAVYSHFEVGGEEGYELSVSGFNAGLSTLGDSLEYSNGAKFSAKDKDQDTWSSNCAVRYKGGGWFTGCTRAHLTGLLTTTSTALSGGAQIYWLDCGDRCG